jgi:hypothetical protein
MKRFSEILKEMKLNEAFEKMGINTYRLGHPKGHGIVHKTPEG